MSFMKNGTISSVYFKVTLLSNSMFLYEHKYDSKNWTEMPDIPHYILHH